MSNYKTLLVSMEKVENTVEKEKNILEWELYC
jgi:hypothetical protein